jgi:hypothetical protein
MEKAACSVSYTAELIIPTTAKKVVLIVCQGGMVYTVSSLSTCAVYV